MLCLIIVYILSSTKLEIRAEQIWPESEGGSRRERKGEGDRGEKWPKQCIHI
jgi:hypothetical protein